MKNRAGGVLILALSVIALCIGAGRGLMADTNGPSADLIVATAPGGDKLDGRHALRLEARQVSGQDWVVGCVPCFDAFTTIAIRKGAAYGLNGYTIQRAKRYRVALDGREIAVRDITSNPDAPGLSLLQAAQSVPGCAIDFGGGSPVEALFEAVQNGRCLGHD